VTAKRVCDVCAVRGNYRVCLECAVPGSGRYRQEEIHEKRWVGGWHRVDVVLCIALVYSVERTEKSFRTLHPRTFLLKPSTQLRAETLQRRSDKHHLKMKSSPPLNDDTDTFAPPSYITSTRPSNTISAPPSYTISSAVMIRIASDRAH